MNLPSKRSIHPLVSAADVIAACVSRSLGSLFTVCASLVLLAMTPLAQAWDHNNFARFSQYNRPVFVAQLQFNSTSDGPESVLTGSYPFRLDLAIAAEFLSDRRFNRLWRESLVLNTSSEQQATEAGALAQLYGFINSDLYRGDHFRVVYTPGRGTSLQINNQPVVFVGNSQLGVLMLQGLLGNVPLSSEFKLGLLSTQPSNEDLAREFLALQPSAARAQQLLPAAPAQERSEAAVAVNEPAQAAPQAPVPVTAAQPSPQARVQQRPKPTVKLSPPSRVSSSNSAPRGAVAAPSSVAIETPKAKPAPKQPVADSQEMIIAKKAYQEELERAIRKYQTIPFKAFSRRMEGDVLLHIAVDDKGYLTRLDLAKPSRYEVLNDQALDAVASAEPFTPMPASFKLKEFSFQLNLSYDLVY